VLKKCNICGHIFSALTNRVKYCSEICAKHKKYYKQKPILKKICKKCEKIFYTRRSDKIFCSSKCKNKYHYIRTDDIKTCKECHKLFPTGKKYQIYCTKICYLKAKNKRNKKEYQERRRHNGP